MIKAILVLLFASVAMASRHTSYQQEDMFPTTSLIFFIIFSLALIPTTLCLVSTIKSKKRLNQELESQSLVGATLPEGVVSSNITVSVRSRPSLLGEIRHDEHLVWAHETTPATRNAAIILLTLAMIFALGGFSTALAFLCVLDGAVDVIFLSLWMPLLFMWGMMLMLGGALKMSTSNTIIFALTSKRVFIYSSIRSAQCCGGKTETVRAYDLDGIHQTTITRREDGSGTLNFSAAAIADGAAYYNNHHGHHLGMFAFTNIPNVTAVKDLIEQYKTLRRKQAGNQ